MKRIICITIFSILLSSITFALPKDYAYYRLATIIENRTGQIATISKIENTGFHKDPSGWEIANEDVYVYIDSPVKWAKGKYLVESIYGAIPEKPKDAKVWFWFREYTYNLKPLEDNYYSAIKLNPGDMGYSE